VQTRDEVSHEIKKIHRAWKSRGMYPTPDEYLRMLKSQVKLFSKVFIVVDALDECLNDPDSNTTDDFLKTLRQLPPTVHFLFTSRHDIGIRLKVQADNEIEIMAQDDDLSKYLKHRINSREHLRALVDTGIKKDNSFLKNLLKTIVERSRGMQVVPTPKDFVLRQHSADILNQISIGAIAYGLPCI
jgi:hypothetical protein